MKKRVILVTGTPCVGKTTVAKELAKQLNGLWVNLTELAKKHNLIIGEDKERETTIIDEVKMRSKLNEFISQTEESTIVIDGHYAGAVTPKNKVAFVFVLRRNPIELRNFMIERGFKERKMKENLASEILDVCLVESLLGQEKGKVCELDVTGKTIEQVIRDILAILDDRKKCQIKGIDWIGMLEREGKIDEYLES